VFVNAAAYGYRYLPIDQPGGGRWEIHESEAAVVQRPFRLCAEEKLSLMAICRRLNGQVPGFEPMPPRKARRWRVVTVNGILTKREPYRHTYEETIAYKMMTPVPLARIWSQKMDPKALNGLTRQQFIQYGLLRLGVGQHLTRIERKGVPRRIAPANQVLALRPDLKPPD